MGGMRTQKKRPTDFSDCPWWKVIFCRKLFPFSLYRKQIYLCFFIGTNLFPSLRQQWTNKVCPLNVCGPRTFGWTGHTHVRFISREGAGPSVHVEGKAHLTFCYFYANDGSHWLPLKMYIESSYVQILCLVSYTPKLFFQKLTMNICKLRQK